MTEANIDHLLDIIAWMPLNISCSYMLWRTLRCTGRALARAFD